MTEFSDLQQALANLRDRVNADAGATENMTISIAPGSVVVEANRSGLLELARLIVMIASKNIDGAHQDFDRAGFVSNAGATLTISLNNALP